MRLIMKILASILLMSLVVGVVIVPLWVHIYFNILHPEDLPLPAPLWAIDFILATSGASALGIVGSTISMAVLTFFPKFDIRKNTNTLKIRPVDPEPRE